MNVLINLIQKLLKSIAYFTFASI